MQLMPVCSMIFQHDKLEYIEEQKKKKQQDNVDEENKVEVTVTSTEDNQEVKQQQDNVDEENKAAGETARGSVCRLSTPKG